MSFELSVLNPVDPIKERQELRRLARQRFLAERQDVLGGSDMVSLLGLEPWGCQRRLCYEKTGIVADFPFKGNADTRRGELCEPLAVREYEELTGRPCETVGLAVGQSPWEAAHLDRVQFAPDKEGMGGLEVKIPRERNYRVLARQPDMPEAYRVQLQWGLYCAKLRWGTVWLWSPDLMRGRHIDYERDDELIGRLRRSAGRFWKELLVWREQAEFRQTPFEHIARLDPADPRCVRCPWRRQCQGLGDVPEEVLEDAALLSNSPVDSDEALTPLVQLYAETRQQKKELEAQQDELADKLKAALGSRQRVECSAGRVSLIDTAPCEYTVKRLASKRLTVRSNRGE